MNNSVLRNNSSKIYIAYNDNGVRKEFPVELRFMDSKECFLCTQIPIGFYKPKDKTKAELLVKTPDGAFRGDVVIIEASVTLSEVTFCVALPQSWVVTELRRNLRVKAVLPFKIRYSDGYEINSYTVNISLNGFMFTEVDEISEQYKNEWATVEIQLPSDTVIKTDCKFIRKNAPDSTNSMIKYVYKLGKFPMDMEYALNSYIRATYMSNMS